MINYVRVSEANERLRNIPVENDIYMIINYRSYDVTKDNGNNNYCIIL